jgi:hypothetical protein
MNCVDSRARADQATRRRYHCGDCGLRCSSIEIVLDESGPGLDSLAIWRGHDTLKQIMALCQAEIDRPPPAALAAYSERRLEA